MKTGIATGNEQPDFYALLYIYLVYVMLLVFAGTYAFKLYQEARQ